MRAVAVAERDLCCPLLAVIYIHVFVCVCVCVSMCVFVGDGYLPDLSYPSSAAAAARALVRRYRGRAKGEGTIVSMCVR